MCLQGKEDNPTSDSDMIHLRMALQKFNGYFDWSQFLTMEKVRQFLKLVIILYTWSVLIE